MGSRPPSFNRPNSGFKEVREDEKSKLVGNVFSSVASSYDLMNDFMNVGLHRLWKDMLVSKLNPFPGMKQLDVAVGTGDVAFRVLDSIKSVSRRAVEGYIKEMDGFNWDIANGVIGELIPLPPCDLRSNLSGEFEESLSHSILDLHQLESSNGDLKIDAVTSSSMNGTNTDTVDSRHVMRHENNLSYPIQEQTNTNPSIKKRHIDSPECPKQIFLAPNSSHRSKRFEIVFGNPSRPKKPKLTASISFSHTSSTGWELDEEAMAEVKEMVYMQAAMQPINLGLEEPVEKPKRKNVRVSSDPQTVAARHRRERISERLRVLQRLVPGGTKLDTASMLDEAASYVKFLQSLIRGLENVDTTVGSMISATSNPMDTPLPLPQTKP